MNQEILIMTITRQAVKIEQLEEALGHLRVLSNSQKETIAAMTAKAAADEEKELPNG